MKKDAYFVDGLEDSILLNCCLSQNWVKINSTSGKTLQASYL